MIKRSECRCICHADAVALGQIEGPIHVAPCCEPDEAFLSVGIEEAINETHAQIKTAVAKRNEEEYKRIWNSAIEAAAHQVMINVFHEAQDSEWDLGFNKCKEVAFNKIRELKK